MSGNNPYVYQEGNKLWFIQTAKHSVALQRGKVALFDVSISLSNMDVACSQGRSYSIMCREYHFCSKRERKGTQHPVHICNRIVNLTPVEGNGGTSGVCEAAPRTSSF